MDGQHSTAADPVSCFGFIQAAGWAKSQHGSCAGAGQEDEEPADPLPADAFQHPLRLAELKPREQQRGREGSVPHLQLETKATGILLSASERHSNIGLGLIEKERKKGNAFLIPSYGILFSSGTPCRGG